MTVAHRMSRVPMLVAAAAGMALAAALLFASFAPADAANDPAAPDHQQLVQQATPTSTASATATSTPSATASPTGTAAGGSATPSGTAAPAPGGTGNAGLADGGSGSALPMLALLVLGTAGLVFAGRHYVASRQ